MGFKKINKREGLLVLVAVVLLAVFAGFHSKNERTNVSDLRDRISVLTLPEGGTKTAPIKPSVVLDQHIEANDHPDIDEAVQKEMNEQMDRDRAQQRQIKMLKLQLEQVDLQLDNEKALTEISKLKKENAGYVKDSNSSMGADYPSIRVIYIGGTDAVKQAILTIDGISYSVRRNDKPVSNIEILDVTAQGVKVHFTAPRELITMINYIQE